MAYPAGMLPKLLKFNVDTSNERQVFRALMCLYLASSAFWVIAALTPEWQIAGLIWAVLFMGDAIHNLNSVIDFLKAPISASERVCIRLQC